MSGFLYGQAVTAEELNGIVIDLGNTDFSAFTNNTPYAVNKLNEITCALVSKGILSSGNKCEVTVDIENQKIIIADGIIVFSSGAKKKITNNLEIDFTVGNAYYVYALNDEANNTCKIVLSEGAPDVSSDHVKLAEISADGSLTDKRVLAKAKCEIFTEGNSYVITQQVGKDDLPVKRTITVPISGVKKIFIKTFNSYPCSLWEYDIETGKFTGAYKRSAGSGDDDQFESNTSEPYIYYHGGSSALYGTLTVAESTENEVTFAYEFNGSSASIRENPVIINYYIYGGI